MTKPLEQLWQDVLVGDRAAWEEIVRHFSGLVFAIARDLGLDPYEAEDCAQQTWLALFRGRRKVRDPSKLSAWLIGTARRRGLQLIRKRTARQRAEDQARLRELIDMPLDPIGSAQDVAMLRLAVNQLDDRCRLLLAGIFFADPARSYSEIAKELGLPPNSIGPTRARCLKKLRTILEEMGYERY